MSRDLRTCISDLLLALEKQSKLNRSNRGQKKEDPLKKIVQGFIEDAAGALVGAGKVVTASEYDLKKIHRRIDVPVYDTASNMPLGFIELKEPAKKVDKDSLMAATGHDGDQFRAFLEDGVNMIYSNGLEWSRFKDGQQVDHVQLPDKHDDLTDEQVESMRALLCSFLASEVIVPRNVEDLAAVIARPARDLRDRIQSILAQGGVEDQKVLRAQQLRWTELFGEIGGQGDPDEMFADHLAQTITYSLLLAATESNDEDFKIELGTNTGVGRVKDELEQSGHNVLEAVYDMVMQKSVYKLLKSPLDAIAAIVNNVDMDSISEDMSEQDPWTYFYEDFLSAYDHEEKTSMAVYYTPSDVTDCMTRLVDFALKTRFGKPMGIGDANVKVIDPATGTGTFLLSTIRQAMKNDADPNRLADRMFAFEIMMGPYAVATMRVSQALDLVGTDLSRHKPGIHLADTLQAPDGGSLIDAIYSNDAEKTIAEDKKRADKVKRDDSITVVLGNPPYDRINKKANKAASRIDRDANGRVTYRNMIKNGPLKQNGKPSRGLIEDFKDPSHPIKGGTVDSFWSWFWRWAIWKTCEQVNVGHSVDDKTGIVAYVTPLTYAHSQGAEGMRVWMRKKFDEIFIINVGGAGHNESVFRHAPGCDIAITIAIRRPMSAIDQYGVARPVPDRDRANRPATVKYMKLTGSSEDKLSQLTTINGLDDDRFEVVEGVDADWMQPLDEPSSLFRNFIDVNDLFPWSRTGDMISITASAPSERILKHRWQAIDGESTPKIVRYGWRSFDSQYAVLTDEPLMRSTRLSSGEFLPYMDSRQLFMTGGPFKGGPAVTVTADSIDSHYYMNSAKSAVHAMFRSAKNDDWNQNANAMRALGSLIYDDEGRLVDSMDPFLYTVGIAGSSALYNKFGDDLSTALALRIPVTSDRRLFEETVENGKKIVCLNTLGARFGEEYDLTAGSAHCDRHATAAPDSIRYDESKHEIIIGSGPSRGIVSDVSPEVWNYNVSGFKVVKWWLKRRTRAYRPSGYNKKPLEIRNLLDIVDSTWAYDDDLLRLLHAIENMIELDKDSTVLLDEVLKSDLVTPDLIDDPTENEKKGPRTIYKK